MSEEGTGRYREQYSVYAGRYGASERTVKRWVAAGKEKGDACPLDDPEVMREWWARNMSQRCPDKLLAAAIEARKSGPGEPVTVPEPVKAPVQDPLMELPVQPQKEKPAPPPLVPRELKPVSEDELGLESTLHRLREAEVQAHRIYVEALAEGNDGKAKLAQKAFTDLAKQVADVEAKVIEQRKASRDLIPRVEAEMLIADFHQTFHGILRGFGDRFLREFGVPVTGDNDVKWQGMIDEVCRHLQQEVFAEE